MTSPTILLGDTQRDQNTIAPESYESKIIITKIEIIVSPPNLKWKKFYAFPIISQKCKPREILPLTKELNN